ncbi:MAG: hypothetical protein PHN31_04965 [Candidatus Gracilibacteria bacterium]|nr:hypothetical protein [Candidatus Gracilibacteria bacterium]
MSNLTDRNINILSIIVREYLETGKVLGSKTLLKKYNLGVSSATVRNDMAILEEMNLIYQPYNSAGRLPTTKGLRAFINYLMQQTPDYFLQEKTKTDGINTKNLNDFVHKLIYELSKNTNEISFLIIEEESMLEYNGIGNFLKRNHGRIGEGIFNIIAMLEDKKNFVNFIKSLPIGQGVSVFIGEENIIPFLKDYTIIMKPIIINGKIGYIGIIGCLKMNYSFNISAIRGII